MLALVAIVLVGAVVLSATNRATRPRLASGSDALVANGSLSSAFYCTGLEHVPGVISGTVAIADLARTPRWVEVTTTDAQEKVDQREVVVDPGRVVHLQPGNFLRGTYLAVSVVASGGDVAVTEALRGENGVAVAPCLSTAGSSWWLTGGSTEPDQSFVVSLYNPYASRAVATVTLSTPQGRLFPSAYGGLVLGPYQLDALYVHAVAPNASPITAHVVATDGAVVVAGIQRGTKAQTSIALLPGAPSPAQFVALPAGSSDATLTTSLVLSTTGDSPVSASVQVLAPAGCTTRCPAPFTVSVPGGQQTASLTVSPSSRVPLGETMALLVHSSAPGVVVTQTVTTAGAEGATVPLDDPGLAGARRLVLLNPLASGFSELVIVNPTDAAVHVGLRTVGTAGTARIYSGFEVAAGSDAVLGSSVLRGTVGGVLELSASGAISAAGVVRGATVGSSTLPGTPR